MIYFSFSETPVQIPLQRHNEWFVLEPAGRTVEGVWALISDGLSLFCILPLGASVTFQVSVSLIHKYLLGGFLEMVLWSMCSINIPITRRSINALAKPFLKKDLVLFLTSKLINGKHFVQTGDLIYPQITECCRIPWWSWKKTCREVAQPCWIVGKAQIPQSFGNRVLTAHYHVSGRFLKFPGRFRGGNGYKCTWPQATLALEVRNSLPVGWARRSFF